MRSHLTCLLLAATGCAEHADAFGPILDVQSTTLDVVGPCGVASNKFISISNPGDQELEVELATDLEGVTLTPSQLVIPSLEGRGVTVIAVPTHHARLTGMVTLTGAGQTEQVPISLEGLGTGVLFDPPILDFGNVLPNTTKQLPVTVTTDDLAPTVGVTLGLPSTPRFEIIGSTTAIIDSTRPTATFTVRYTASSAPQVHTGSMAVDSSGSTCVPELFELKGTTVP